MEIEPGLYMVATPIGNLGDVTRRALHVLASVDVVYAEDTRVTKGLLQKYDIATPCRSYREAADRSRVDADIVAIANLIQEGKSVAYASDAGTPGISDPGAYLVSRLVEMGIRVVPIPGASALATLLSAAGMPAEQTLYEGFLPHKKGRQTRLAQLKDALQSGICQNIVLYESPYRVEQLAESLLSWELPLRVVVGRELTKKFEEVLYLDETGFLQAAKQPKGEFAIIISLDLKRS